MRKLRRFLVVCTAAALTACGAFDPEPNPQPSGTPPEVTVCELFSTSVVQPYLNPIADGRSLGPVIPGIKMCSYRIEAVNQLRQIRGLIDYTYMDTPEDALGSVQFTHDEAVNRGLTNIEWLTGLGDKAFISQEGETVGIKLARGRLMMQINFGKEGAPFSSLADVVKGLGEKAMETMPKY